MGLAGGVGCAFPFVLVVAPGGNVIGNGEPDGNGPAASEAGESGFEPDSS